MKMLRHYLISDSLDDLELFEEQLEAAGVSTPQIHVLSPNDAEVERHFAPARGAILHEERHCPLHRIGRPGRHGRVRHGADGRLPRGLDRTPAGWTPFIFLAVVLLGFCTWEGGLIGIQKPNHNFARFKQALKDGKHVFFVDLEPRQEAILEEVLKSSPAVVGGGARAHAALALTACREARHRPPRRRAARAGLRSAAAAARS